MKNFVLLFTVCLSLGIVFLTGCDSRPDPRKNPDFNEGALTNPGSIEMKPLGGGKPKT
jgi:hypothetical protein